MKIVFNTDQIYLHGGIEKVMATKANYFANLPEVEVCIVTTEQQGNLPRYSLHPKIKLIDLGVNYDRSKSYFSSSNFFKLFQHFKEQRKLFKSLDPDVVISPNYNFDHYWLPFIHPRSKKIKERHSSRFYEKEERKSASLFKKIKIWIDDEIDKKYNYIVVLNKDEEKYLASKNGVVIPNPVEIPDFVCDLVNKKVITAGRIAPVKGFDELIKAWNITNQKFPDWELHIYGENYSGTKEKLEELIRDLQLEKSVTFKGNVSDLPTVMQDYSMYAMSSETECFPTVLLEALSVGLPIVSYDCPNGPRHIIRDNEHGFLAQQKKPADLADKLMLLMNDEILRKKMGGKAREHSQSFSNTIVMKKWCELLNLQNV